ncbi:MAG: DciA family protein [Burkholderiales bacterium]
MLAKARDLRALAGLVEGFLSPDLARQARVANFREGELVLLAAHSAAAAKLRLLAPSLSRFLTHQRWQVNSVSVRVQPTTSRIAATQKSAHFSTRTLDSLKELYEEMGPSPARQALAELLARRGVIAPAKAPHPRTTAARPPGRKPRT